MLEFVASGWIFGEPVLHGRVDGSIGEVAMFPRFPQPTDLLRDLRREESWLGRIAQQGLTAPEATVGLDDLMAALRSAFALRRRLEAQLASDRELQELTGVVLLDRDDEEPSLAEAGQLKAG